jgi:hypothetical protein
LINFRGLKGLKDAACNTLWLLFPKAADLRNGRSSDSLLFTRLPGFRQWLEGVKN